MPKRTKLLKVAAEVAGIVGAYCSVENHIVTLDNGAVENKYKIWDSGLGKWFEAATLDETFQKFKEARGISINDN